jgi:radical SAM protein with 4Fe4S-binding SPASM domain
MKNKSIDYGSPVLSSGWVNFDYRLRNRIITSMQYGFLKIFRLLNHWQRSGSLFSRISRKIIGGYIYSIKLEINTRCNLACRMCYVPEYETDLEFSLIEQLMRQVRNSGTRLEILGGEPLIREDLPEIVRLAKKTGRIPFVSVYTNGTFATKERCTALKRAGLDAAIVTLISSAADTHSQFTGVRGSWEKTIRGITNLRDAGIKTYTFSAIHAENKDDIEEIQKFVTRELKVEPLFYQYIPQQERDPLMIDRKLWYQLKNRILRGHPSHAAFVRDFEMLTGNACSGGNFVFTVKADGSVQPCPFISDIPLGNIRTENIWTIFKNRYKETGLTQLKCLPDSCKACSYSSVCGGGCRAGNKMLSGSYATADFRCLGPFDDPITTNCVTDRIPCFF